MLASAAAERSTNAPIIATSVGVSLHAIENSIGLVLPSPFAPPLPPCPAMVEVSLWSSALPTRASVRARIGHAQLGSS
eukprot:3500428-Rhodomonas_salina.1